MFNVYFSSNINYWAMPSIEQLKTGKEERYLNSNFIPKDNNKIYPIVSPLNTNNIMKKLNEFRQKEIKRYLLWLNEEIKNVWLLFKGK